MPENIVLVGLPGSGKTRVGRALAEATGLALIDLDHAFSAVHGIPPAQYIENYGERAFRALESTIAQTPRHASIIATGGGAVIDPISRWHLWHSGLVVWLDGDDELLHDRIDKGTHRPLTTSIAALRARRAERTPFYAAADLRLDAALPCDEKVRLILDAAAHPLPTARTLYRAEVRRDHPMGPPTASIEMGHRLDAASLTSLVAKHSTGDPVVVVDRN
ncbi:MAG: shikimate kinase, partial [Ruaniaceae bacterium]|nr:shikimate kinase [Ruaniaceae bacterium]